MYKNDIYAEVEVESVQDKCCQTMFTSPKTKDQIVQTDGQVIIMEESVQTTAQQVRPVLIDKSSGMASQIVMIHCKKKSVQCTPNMVCYVCPNWNTLYGVKSHHILGVCLTPNWVCFHTNSVCFPTNFSVFSHSL